MLWKGFQRPKRIEVEHSTLTPTYGKFTAQPFERGFGTTIGNALRRCLLSSIEGAAVTAVQIDGVLHEFSSLTGVVDDVTDLILNLKDVPIRYEGDEPVVVRIEVDGPAEVRAADIQSNNSVEVCNPDVRIATVNEEGKLRLQARISSGRGYVSADKNFDETLGIGWIPLDSVHTPVRRVNYKVDAARVGRDTDYEKLTIEVWTDGTVTPEVAMSRGSMLLKDHLAIFMSAEESIHAEPESLMPEVLSGLDAVLEKNIDELDLSVRSANCLKNANINTLRDLVRRSEREMMETKNFGKKSLEELQDLLSRLGLSFGMDVPDRPAGSAI
jgi:DNA-directed RNA polymerase subunit alpha